MGVSSLTTFLALAGCAAHAVAEPAVYPVRFHRSALQSANLAKRASDDVTLDNAVSFGLYSVNVTVGTPGQQLTLQVDTGSSDIWFFSPDACNEAMCIDGEFDPTKSSTYKLVQEGTFNITYVDGSGATGNYISDVISLDGGLEVKNQTMSLATKATDNQIGLFGIAFQDDEAANDLNFTTFVGSLYNAGVIKSNSYSLWLDDLESSTGTILFGGYDPDQYIGDLTVLPILPDFDEYLFAGNTTISSFTVDLSMIALTSGSSSTVLQQAEYPIPAVLDSGTTLTVLPPDTFFQLAEYFGATYDSQQGGYLVDCDIANWKGSLDYGFGGDGGAIVQVPFSELAINAGNNTCQFGLEPAGDVPLLGDTFLRSAYVVYDLSSDQIAIGQSAWNSTTSNPKEIAASDDLAYVIPNAKKASSATVPYADYTSLAAQLGSTATSALNGSPQTAYISGVTTTLPVSAAPTEPGAATAASTSPHSGAAAPMRTAAMMLPMALPFAAALM